MGQLFTGLKQAYDEAVVAYVDFCNRKKNEVDSQKSGWFSWLNQETKPGDERGWLTWYRHAGANSQRMIALGNQLNECGQDDKEALKIILAYVLDKKTTRNTHSFVKYLEKKLEQHVSDYKWNDAETLAKLKEALEQPSYQVQTSQRFTVESLPDPSDELVDIEALLQIETAEDINEESENEELDAAAPTDSASIASYPYTNIASIEKAQALLIEYRKKPETPITPDNSPASTPRLR